MNCYREKEHSRIEGKEDLFFYYLFTLSRVPRIELANCEDRKLFVKQINESNLLSTYCVHLTFVHLENNAP